MSHPSIHPSIYLSFLPSFLLSFYLYIMTLVFARLTHFDPTLVDQRFNGCWWITAWKSWTVRDFCHSRLTAALKARNLWLVPRRLACLKNTSTAAEIWMECKTNGFSCCFFLFKPPIQEWSWGPNSQKPPYLARGPWDIPVSPALTCCVSRGPFVTTSMARNRVLLW